MVSSIAPPVLVSGLNRLQTPTPYGAIRAAQAAFGHETRLVSEAPHRAQDDLSATWNQWTSRGMSTGTVEDEGSALGLELGGQHGVVVAAHQAVELVGELEVVGGEGVGVQLGEGHGASKGGWDGSIAGAKLRRSPS